MIETLIPHAPWALALLPLLYGIAALALPQLTSPALLWRGAISIALTALGLTAVAGAALLAGSPSVTPLLSLPEPLAGLSILRFEALTLIMMSLVGFIGLAILRYSQNYLAGEARQGEFVRWFFATLASVSLLIVTDHILILLAGWIAASLSLHRLLVFYPERTQAVLAAHKKFLLSRVADLCLVIGLMLLAQRYQSFSMEAVFSAVSHGGKELSGSFVAATVLIALAMILKCAQLPFHGWLLQVMEAPTPVSALLHAGIVNLGGFLLIRLAPVMSISPAAQWLLVMAGSLTAVIAAMVMMTRISIKVSLAWSTCSQMGFMIMECGLGAYSLALLHLVAHSLYKAHCFLASGGAVASCIKKQSAGPAEPPSLTGWMLALPLSFAIVFAALSFFQLDLTAEPSLWAMAGIVGAGLASLLSEAHSLRRKSSLLLAIVVALAAGLLYCGWHAVVGGVPLAVSTMPPSTGMLAWILGAFGLQLLLCAASRMAPKNQRMARLHACLYHGLYLDEVFTRLTFLIWPPRIVRRDPAAKPQSALPQAVNQGVS